MTKSKLTLKLNIVTAKMPKSVKEGDLLITTKAALYHFQQEKCNKIGTGEYFGVTSNNLDRVWLFEAFTNLRVGRLIEFRKKNHENDWSAFVILKNLSRGIHQIYHYDGYVLLMDTYNNAIMKYCPKSCAITETSYPFGRLRDGRQSTNYMHMNSITRHKDGFLVMCHNENNQNW